MYGECSAAYGILDRRRSRFPSSLETVAHLLSMKGTVMNRVIGKVVLISGGARGMGASHARVLAAEGAHVVIGDIIDAGSQLAHELGDRARFIHLDVTKPDEWKQAVDTALHTFGRLDVLINNAGIISGGTVAEFELEVWQRIIDVDLTGTFNGIKAVVPAMIAARRGSIINISSMQAIAASAGNHAYVAAKFGVRGLTKSTAVELAEYGIRVNSVHPGLIKTPMTDGIDASSIQIPLKRAAAPEEVSNLVLYLASDESGYSTGSEFIVDGGVLAGLPKR